MNDFDGKTWVAFSDLSGLKALYEKKPEDAAKALDKFYNTIYDMQEVRNPINAIVVSDCAIFWIDRNNCVGELVIILEHLKRLHHRMLPDYLLRTTVAYGHFTYRQRLEMPRIRKNMIVGGAYLDAYANNDKIDHGAIVVVKLPEGTSYRDLHFVNKPMIKANCPKKGLYEYIWAVENHRQIKTFIKERDEANIATFSKLKELYSGSQNHEVDIVEITRAGNKSFKAKIGLLPETYWQSDLRDYPTKLLRTIRKLLEKSVPRLTEKFNPTTLSLRYFGYQIKKSKSISDISKKAYSEDKAYIYVRPEMLEIDLKIDPRFANDIKRDGFEVRPKTNYQAQADWVTGWQVPHSTDDIATVMKWLCKAFDENL